MREVLLGLKVLSLSTTISNILEAIRCHENVYNCVTLVTFCRLLEMAFMFKLVSVLIVLSIFSDVTSPGGRWFNSNRHAGDIRFMQSPSLIFPGANAKALDPLLTAVVKAVVKEILSGEKKDKGG